MNLMKMKHSSIPCRYQPTRALFIDDNENFLKSLKLMLPMTMLSKRYSDPMAALKFLNEEYTPALSYSDCICHPEDQDQDETNLSIHIKNIHKNIYSSSRFNDISVIIVDYSMPGKNGLSLFRSLKNKRIKKVLLTGNADSNIAVEAFNEGIIDQFVLKNNDTLRDTLIKAITDLKSEYNLSFSKEVTKAIIASGKPLPFLNDPAFIDLFYTTVDKHQIVEYYLLDESGSFLMLDINANPIWFIVKDEEEMRSLSDIAKFGGASREVVAELESRVKIPYFHSDADFRVSPENWKSFLHPATHLKAKKNYYYSVLENPPAYPLERELITPFKRLVDLARKRKR